MNAVLKFTYSVALIMSFLFIIVASNPIYSAEMVIFEKEIVFIDGDILEGDGEKFTKLLDENPDIKYVSLNSYGGFVFEGMQIAFAVHEKQLVTFVTLDGNCDSMCSVIFISGFSKVLKVGQSIGFHPAYLQWDDGKTEVDPQTSAYISWWLGRMGVPSKIVWEMMETDPKTVVSYTAVELVNMGMDVFLME